MLAPMGETLKMIGSETIHDELAVLAEHIPDSVALLAPGRNALRFRRLWEQIRQTISVLNNAGVSRKDRIGIIVPNGSEMALCTITVAACATSVPLNPAYRESEFDFYIGSLDIKALVIQRDLDSPARRVAQIRHIPVITLDPNVEDEAGVFHLQADGASKGPVEAAITNPEDVAVILHTSGVTGRPKIVPLTHSSICASTKNIRKALDLVQSDRCINVMPLFHAHGLIIAVLSSLLSGSSVVCTPGFDPDRFFEWMNLFHPTWYTASPTIHQGVLESASQNHETISPNSLRFIRSSAAPLSQKVAEGLEALLRVPLIQAYGMTECVQITSNPLPPRLRKPGSVGVVAGPELAVVHPLDRPVPPYENGEVVIGGTYVTEGQEFRLVNESSRPSKWLRTGDQGYMDEEGYLYITGRFKEMINCGGEKIAPREIDEVLLDHPAVAQAVTFAVPHPTLGEDIAAAVVLHKGASLQEKDLRDFISPRLSDFKIPRQFLFLNEIPKGPTGKLHRIDLAQRLGIAGTNSQGKKLATHSEQRELNLEMLTKIWSEVLQVDNIGHEDNFFRLGGDSIRATQLLARLRKRYQIHLPLSSLFHSPTLKELFVEVQREANKADRPQPTIQPPENQPKINEQATLQRTHPQTSDADVKFSLFFFSADESTATEDKYRLLMESAVFADRHGYAAIWTPERHFHSFGGLYPNPAVVGAALAKITNRIQIRAGSVVLPLQNPVRVAEEWSIVDNLSNGRVAVSFASGWHANDFVLYPQNYERRRDVMYDGIRTIQTLWQGKSIPLVNGAGNLVDVTIYPRPVQQELPIFISCHSKETFKKAGAMGANVVTAMYFLTLEELAEDIEIYRKSLREHGYNERQRSVALMIHTFLGDNMEVVRDKVKSAYVDYLLVNLGLHSTQAKGAGEEFDPTESDKEFMMQAAIDKLFKTGLIGTVDSSLQKVEMLRSIGVDEIACLIDFGIDFDSVMSGLYQLNRLKELSTSRTKAGTV